MKITIWGSRGSLPSPSPETTLIGGNTSCVQVEDQHTSIILDAGSGIRRMNGIIPPDTKQIDILLTHLHMDHIMGLGFFGPLYNPNMKVTIWGPSSTNQNLASRLTRYLSPPLFPIRLQDLPCKLQLRELNDSHFQIGSLKIRSSFVCHPGPTLGYRIENQDGVLAYIPDHEPQLGSANFPHEPDWTSGYALAKEANVLIHDAQYTKQEYQTRVGFGHSTFKYTFQFATMAKVDKLLLFHHDPAHTDQMIQQKLSEELMEHPMPMEVAIAAEGDCYDLPW